MKRLAVPWLACLVACGIALLGVASAVRPVRATPIVIDPLTGLEIRRASPEEPAAVGGPETAVSGIVQQFQETSYYFKDLVCAGANACLAVGADHWDDGAKDFRGTITKSSDGGKTWQALDAGSAPLLWAVAYPDPQHAWAVGDGGAILHTSDGGASWVQQTVASQQQFIAVAFADALHGWAAAMTTVHTAWSGDPDDWRTTIWRTANGGVTWTQGAAPADMSIVHDLEAIDADHAWAVGVRVFTDQHGRLGHHATIWHTADGGASWQAVYAPAIEVSLTAVDFVDATHGWAAGFPTSSGDRDGATFRTTDGGATWTRNAPGDSFGPLWDIRFLDRQRGYAVGFNYAAAWGPPVWRTLDGGASWTQVRMSKHESNGIFGVAVFEDHVLALGDHDYLARSEEPWTACPNRSGCMDCECFFAQSFLNTHYTFHDVFFTGPQTGCAVGAKSYDISITGHSLFRTTDGGQTWSEQYQHKPETTFFSFHRLESVDFADARNGWATGTSATFSGSRGWEERNSIIHTTDGGVTWREQGRELVDSWGLEFPAVQALSAQEAWALALRRFPSTTVFLAHTTDGGAHWTWVDTGIEAAIGVGYAEPQGALRFTDAQHGWVGGWNAVLRTTDGGQHWSKLTLSCGYPVCYPASQAIDLAGSRGWLAGDNLWRSDDGLTWTDTKLAPHAASGQLLQFYDVQFLDAKAGWAVGNQGALLYTATAGGAWGRLPYMTSYNLNGIAFLDSAHGWIVGDAGVIFKVDLRRFPPISKTYLPLLLKK